MGYWSLVRGLVVSRRRQISLIFLVSILLLAAFLRLYRISEYMTFLGDEGRDALVVMRMIVDHKFTLLGPNASVGGFFLGPIYYYFMLPFMWAWRLDPSGPAVMVALFGVATVYLVYRVGKDFIDELTGLIAASLYALSPIVISYSRSSWNPNPVPFFSLLLIYFLWQMVVVKRWEKLFWVGLVVGIGLQLHYLFLFLLPIVMVWIIIFGPRKILLPYIFGLSGFVVGFAPFLLFELRHGFPNLIAISRFIVAGKETGLAAGNFLQNLTDVPFRLFSRLVFRFPTPDRFTAYQPWLLSVWRMGTWTVIISSLASLIGNIRRFKKIGQAKSRAAALLLLWFTVIVLLFGFYKKAIYEYYFGIFFPFPFLATAAVFSYFIRSKHLVWIGIILWLGVGYLNWAGRPFIHPPNNQYAQMRRIAQAAYEMTGGRQYNFALITDGNSDHVYRFFFELWGNKPVTIENTDIDPTRRSVTEQLIVICENPACQPLGHPLWEVAGFGRAEILREQSVPFVKIFQLVHYKEE